MKKALGIFFAIIIMTVLTFGTTAGPNAPGTGADDATVGTAAWNNPSNILAEGGGTASILILSASITSHYLKATNFGFSIPAGSTINGITVEIRKRIAMAFSATAVDSEVKIVKADGTIGSTNKASASLWPADLTYSTYGGSSDLWGETWSPSNINDSDFGTVISAIVTDGAGDEPTIQVDFIRITIDYTESSGKRKRTPITIGF